MKVVQRAYRPAIIINKMVVFTNIENVRMSVKCRCKWTPQFFVFILAKKNHKQSAGVSVLQKFVPSVLPKKSHIDPHLYIFSSYFFNNELPFLALLGHFFRGMSVNEWHPNN